MKGQRLTDITHIQAVVTRNGKPIASTYSHISKIAVEYFTSVSVCLCRSRECTAIFPHNGTYQQINVHDLSSPSLGYMDEAWFPERKAHGFALRFRKYIVCEMYNFSVLHEERIYQFQFKQSHLNLTL